MKKLLVYMFLLLPFLVSSCESEGNENSLPPADNVTYIRFVSPSGTNVLDSLNVLEGNGDMCEINPEHITFAEHHTQASKPCDFRQYYLRTSKQMNYFAKEETIAELHWVDFDVRRAKAGSTFTYSIEMSGRNIFGDDNVHTLKWYLNVYDGGTFDAYKCEVDGKETDLSRDPFYTNQTSHDRRSVAAFITIECK